MKLRESGANFFTFSEAHLCVIAGSVFLDEKLGLRA